MARPLRIELAGGLYHVTSRGDRRENIYFSDEDRLEVAGTSRGCLQTVQMVLPCLVPNEQPLPSGCRNALMQDLTPPLQVAKAKGATYFELPGTSWEQAETQLGTKKMWDVNKKFLEIQVAQGKSFEFTVDPRSVKPDSYTALEINYLINNGYRLQILNGEYRAVIK